MVMRIGPQGLCESTLTVFAWEECPFEKSVPKTAETSHDFSP